MAKKWREERKEIRAIINQTSLFKKAQEKKKIILRINEIPTIGKVALIGLK